MTTSQEYQQPTYSYQRANYYYPNVTYADNNRLVDPFRPESGQIHIRDLGLRVARNIASVPVSLAESAVVPEGYAPYFGMLLQRILPRQISSRLVALLPGVLWVGCLSPAYSHWLMPLWSRPVESGFLLSTLQLTLPLS